MFSEPYNLMLLINILHTSSVGGVQARNRWLVAYTLIRNPSLVKLTASNLISAEVKEGKNETCEDSTEMRCQAAPPVVMSV